MTREKSVDQLAREAAGSPPTSLGLKGVSIGTVKYWRDNKGSGVITCAELAPWDVWCHFAQIEMPGYKTLTPGQRVEVEWYWTIQDSFRFRAARVRPLSDAESPAPDVAPGAG